MLILYEEIHAVPFHADQAPSQSKLRADEGPSLQIFKPGINAGWDAMA
jgi:hypothetical protein